ncbi:MAG TPA: CoA-transferase [Alphaproteobacteria bacterium]|nr:CoA-transferase [Alphaproteobacteria bacterium]
MKPVSLVDLIAPIRPGTLLAIPPDYSGVSIAATRALITRGTGGLRLVAVPTSGLQADLLIGAGLVDELEAAAVLLGELGPAPRFAAAVTSGKLRMKDTTCPALHAALQASEKGVPFMPLRGLIGSDVQKNRPDWKLADNPFAPDGTRDPIVLLPAIRPDVALFHATKADREGNVWIGRRRELVTMAHAAKETIVTVEEIVDGSLLADEATAAGVLPSLYVSAIAEAKNGARPLGLQDLYAVDDGAIARYAEAARTEAGFREWLDRFMDERRAAA